MNPRIVLASHNMGNAPERVPKAMRAATKGKALWHCRLYSLIRPEMEII
jgi:hypothetical protein